MAVLIDSCGWIQMAVRGRHAIDFAGYLARPEEVIVPSLVQFEVYRWLCRTVKKQVALRSPVLTLPVQVVPLTTGIALRAADLAHSSGLAMADAIVVATADQVGASVVTCDTDLAGLPGVVVLE